MGRCPDRRLGERVLPGYTAEISAVLRPGYREMRLSAGERDVLGGRGREGRDRERGISRTARSIRPGSTQAGGHPAGGLAQQDAGTVNASAVRHGIELTEPEEAASRGRPVLLGRLPGAAGAPGRPSL